MGTSRAKFVTSRSGVLAAGLLLVACGSPGSGGDSVVDRSTAATATDAAITTLSTPSGPESSTVTTATTTTISKSIIEDGCDVVISIGCEGADVQTLQMLLTDRGFGDLVIDGIFGPATEAALRRFEDGCGTCTADGAIEIDGDEWHTLGSTEPSTVEFASVFDAFVGGGTPSNICAEVAQRFTWPDGAFFGFGLSLGDAGDVSLPMALKTEMCITGFDFSRPVDVTIERDSKVRTVSVSAGPASNVDVNDVFDDGGPTSMTFEFVPAEFGDESDYIRTAWDRLVEPSLPGSYVVTVSQDDVAATRNVEIEAGDYGDPGLRVITADDFSSWNPATPGSTLTMVLAGFTPNGEVPLALYGSTEEFTEVGAVFELLTPLESAIVNEQGLAFVDIVVPALESRGSQIWDYCIATVESLRRFFCQPFLDAVFDVAE